LIIKRISTENKETPVSKHDMIFFQAEAPKSKSTKK
jgi:hypothetical protein